MFVGANRRIVRVLGLQNVGNFWQVSGNLPEIFHPFATLCQVSGLITCSLLSLCSGVLLCAWLVLTARHVRIVSVFIPRPPLFLCSLALIVSHQVLVISLAFPFIAPRVSLSFVRLLWFPQYSDCHSLFNVKVLTLSCLVQAPVLVAAKVFLCTSLCVQTPVDSPWHSPLLILCGLIALCSAAHSD